MSGGPSVKTLKVLFAQSGNRCAAPGCDSPVVVDATPFDRAAVIGQVAHIVARSPEGPRGVRNFREDRLHDESNLILLCGHHHALVDAQGSTFTADELRGWKAAHQKALESFSSAQLPGLGGHVSPDLVDDQFLDTEIVILLQGENLFGGQIYSYLLTIGRDLKRMFEAMRAGRNFKPSDYGTVLHSGDGAPPADVRARMNEEYNMVDVEP